MWFGAFAAERWTTLRASVTALALMGSALGANRAVAAAERSTPEQEMAALRERFVHPPPEARPWVYWYFMDGNMTADGMRHDLEAMKKAGIGGAILLEVDIGIPRGPVPFMSPEWQRLVEGAIADADRLGIQIALGTGPGWCGDGGPWVQPEDAMQHLVGAETQASGPAAFDKVLERPKPHMPFFGMGTLTPALKQQWESFYRDVAVVAFPTPAGNARTADIEEKALYIRPPFSSQKGVKPYLPDPAQAAAVPAEQCVPADKIVDLTDNMDASGRLRWEVPKGHWTIVRLGRTLTGQTTRPAPAAGLGFETDKFTESALDHHFANYVDKILAGLKTPASAGANRSAGLTMLHFDSWEMGAQNWSPGFREEFKKRRGYDPLPYLPAMLGRVIGSPQMTERFLWDLRQTASELTVEKHAMHLRDLAHQRGLSLSIEPYDLNPSADLKLGMAADLPMGEFWSTGYGFQTEYSVIEATSVGHTMGKPVIGAEAFTAGDNERWKQYPASMKAQADWALCAGINKFDFHRYQHQPMDDEFPGMTMGPYGVHWERTQTWWDFVPAFHQYLSRCSQLLREGQPVADILYLTPEGAPMVFRPPADATRGPQQDKQGYSFDGCSPDVLMTRVSVKDGQLVLPEGTHYRVLVLPQTPSMTPALLKKVRDLLMQGATVIGRPPEYSPSLSGYPKCDEEVRSLARSMWGTEEVKVPTDRQVGAGRLIVYPADHHPGALYPDYALAAWVLKDMGVAPDFTADQPLRYIHRSVGPQEIYFVANPAAQAVHTDCHFRATGKPEWWDPITGERRSLPQYSVNRGVTTIPLRLEATGSGFVVFTSADTAAGAKVASTRATSPGGNFPAVVPVFAIPGPWQVHFEPAWGGPDQVTFDKLEDWTRRPEPGIRGYSGKAVYRTTFAASPEMLQDRRPLFLSMGDVKAMASVRLNGIELGVAWCPPWRVRVPASLLKSSNELEVTVANLWINRLITDAGLPVERRLTKTTWNPFKPGDPLEPSGLLGPVQLEAELTP